MKEVLSHGQVVLALLEKQSWQEALELVHQQPESLKGHVRRPGTHRNAYASSLLGWAVTHGAPPELLTEWVSLGANVNQRTTAREIPLMMALEHLRSTPGHRMDTAKTLLDLGARCNVLNDGGRSPLQVGLDMFSEPLARRLLAGGARLEHLDEAGDPILTRIISKTDEVAAGWLDFYLHAGADVNQLGFKHSVRGRDDQRCLAASPLCTALSRRDFDVAQRLVEHGARLDLQYDQGLSLITMFATSMPVLRWLQDQGLSIDTPDDFGKSPLLQFVSLPVWSVEAIRNLLQCGADVDAEDDHGIGHTPRSCIEAQSSSYPDVLSLMRSIDAAREARKVIVDMASPAASQSGARP